MIGVSGNEKVLGTIKTSVFKIFLFYFGVSIQTTQ